MDKIAQFTVINTYNDLLITKAHSIATLKRSRLESVLIILKKGTINTYRR